MTVRVGLVSAIGATALAFGSVTGDARSGLGQNVDLMAKWTAATVVRYRVVAEFSGEAVIVETPDTLKGFATVTDRFEVDFDWNQQEYSLVGKPVVRNFPTKVVSLSMPRCPITVSGAFELATVVEVRNSEALRYANAAEAVVKRDMPAGTVSTMNEYGPCASVRPAPARTLTIQMGISAAPGMALALPSGQGGFEHDGKTFVIKAAGTQDKGWTFRVTPTIVK
jgi:hypothetical protein